MPDFPSSTIDNPFEDQDVPVAYVRIPSTDVVHVETEASVDAGGHFYVRLPESTFEGLIRELKITNAYLALMTDEELTELDVMEE